MVKQSQSTRRQQATEARSNAAMVGNQSEIGGRIHGENIDEPKPANITRDRCTERMLERNVEREIAMLRGRWCNVD